MTGTYTNYQDAAKEGCGFRVGIVRRRGFYRSYRAPVWIQMLLQVELYGVYHAACKLAVYMGG